MKSFLFAIAVIAGTLTLFVLWSTSAGGTSFNGALPPLTSEESEAADRMATVVSSLASEIGGRGRGQMTQLEATESVLERMMNRTGLDFRPQTLRTSDGNAHVYVATILGQGPLARETIVLGAHYDTAERSPGADDNASGCAVLLEVARALAGSRFDRSLTFCFFSQGAYPAAGNERAVSWSFARECRKHGTTVVGMLSLDTLGCFTDKEKSQTAPIPYAAACPDRGNFVAFIGPVTSRGWISDVTAAFRANAHFPSWSLALPGWYPGTRPSDDVCFSEQGVPALTVTDTGTWRNTKVETMYDLGGELDVQRMARVALGLARAVAALASKSAPHL